MWVMRNSKHLKSRGSKSQMVAQYNIQPNGTTSPDKYLNIFNVDITLQSRQYIISQVQPNSLNINSDCDYSVVATCSLEMISSLVRLTMLTSSTANAGYEMMARSPASTSLDMEALGSIDVRMD